MTSSANGVELVFYHVRLGEIFHVPAVGLAEYVWRKDENCLFTSKFTQGRVIVRPRKVLKCFLGVNEDIRHLLGAWGWLMHWNKKNQLHSLP